MYLRSVQFYFVLISEVDKIQDAE